MTPTSKRLISEHACRKVRGSEDERRDRGKAACLTPCYLEFSSNQQPALSNSSPRVLILNPLRLEAGDSRLQARVPLPGVRRDSRDCLPEPRHCDCEWSATKPALRSEVSRQRSPASTIAARLPDLTFTIGTPRSQWAFCAFRNLDHDPDRDSIRPPEVGGAP
jgi:hypothetical protein